MFVYVLNYFVNKFLLFDMTVHCEFILSLISDKPNIHFQHKQGKLLHGPAIEFFGSPFMYEKSLYMECAQGSSYRQSKETVEQLPDHPNCRKKKFLIHSSKKIGCQARMTLKCVRVYPDFTSPDSKRKKCAVVKKLKDALREKVPITSYLRYYVKISTDESHNHTPTAAHLCQQIHPDLVAEIKRLVDQGVTATRDVKLLLEQYVRSKFSGDKTSNRLSKAFYPEQSVIYAHVYREIFSKKGDQMDQEVLQRTINEWKLENSEDCFFYRPYEEVSDCEVSPLLFCHQTKWQQKLLLRYGSMCLLDATYKTTKYALPLFFLAVKTNVGYSVVGTFVVQSESTALIAEALNVFKEWLPEWQPQFWMTDFSEMEIVAIEKTFPGNTVYLCAFHREQAWLRWVKKSGNVTSGDSEEILSMWRAIASSRDTHEFDLNLEVMSSNDIMQQNPKAADYLATHWLPHKHRWVQAFSEKDFVTIIHTNNGIESQNKVLKHSYLCHNSDKSLTGMLKTVINSYLPDMYRKYCYKNSTVKMFNPEIPSYLINRPQNFIKHVLTRISAARSDICKEYITEISKGIFRVQSSTDKNKFYCVNFDSATCSCTDFMNFRFPCKHMCAIFEFFPNWSFLQLNSAYTKSPYITLDSNNSYCTTTDIRNPFSTGTANSENISTGETVVNCTSTPTEEASEVSSSISSYQREFRNFNKMLIESSYVCKDKTFFSENIEVLRKMHTEMEGKIKKISGLPLIQLSPLASIASKKIKEKYKMLPLRKKRRTRVRTGVTVQINLS
ncbi:uncharacterized protein LOC134533814 isoform X1 [Bacillus rossius redtenbacheri]|uniref:uncharacterized protein LOC134533814 isoform X1 n=1 Tax=Bacillus rossius redtenbacheri TaxID=93214 RepID=UPI002FDEC3AF